MHFLLVSAAHPWSGLDPRARRAVTAVELCFPGTGGLYSSMEWFTLLHCQVARGLLGLLIHVMSNHSDQTLWTWSYTWQTWVCSSSPAGFLCGIWKCVYPSHTSVLPIEKEKKWESCSYLPGDWEVKLEWTGKCWIWGAVRYRNVLLVCLWLEGAAWSQMLLSALYKSRCVRCAATFFNVTFCPACILLFFV